MGFWEKISGRGCFARNLGMYLRFRYGDYVFEHKTLILLEIKVIFDVLK